MAFQVIRVEKLKSAARLSGRLRHAMRDRVPENADPARIPDNTYGVPNSAHTISPVAQLPAEERTARAMARFRSLLPAKFRKDAVQAIEILVTASREAFEGTPKAAQNKYFEASLQWIAKRFGGKENIVAMTIHRDETTPHMSVFVVPRVTRERDGVLTVGLSAKEYVDGPRALHELQTEFHEQVSKRFGLERGREWSPAKHESVRSYYAKIKEAAQQDREALENRRIATRKHEGREK